MCYILACRCRDVCMWIEKRVHHIHLIILSLYICVFWFSLPFLFPLPFSFSVPSTLYIKTYEYFHIASICCVCHVMLCFVLLSIVYCFVLFLFCFDSCSIFILISLLILVLLYIYLISNLDPSWELTLMLPFAQKNKRTKE